MKRGFTLIELLVVIAIIGILAAIVALNYPAYFKRARDTQRKSDIRQYQMALENYANGHNSTYPIFDTQSPMSHLSTVCTDTTSGMGLTTCPEDPQNSSNSTYYYRYFSDSTGLNYAISAKMESLSTSTSNVWWVACANGISDLYAGNGTPALTCTGSPFY